MRLVIIGDSTVCNYRTTSPSRGWGHFIEERFKDGAVRLINLGAAGRSSKTFIQDGRWQKALDQKPNYVLIQFGHNDSHPPDKPESTNAAADYKGYLRRYIDESRTIGATPILVRPDKTGKCLRQAVRIPPISWAPEWMPYTILGDDQWQDYQVSADVCMNPGDSAGIMGRVNNVGTGYGSVPKDYFLEFVDNGQCRLVVIGGKKTQKSRLAMSNSRSWLMRAGMTVRVVSKCLAAPSFPTSAAISSTADAKRDIHHPGEAGGGEHRRN